MKYKIKFGIAVFIILMILSNCTHSVIDFSVITSKNLGLKFDKANGVRVEGSAHFPYSIYIEVETAINRALEQAGPEYDILVDAVASRSSYNAILYWWSQIEVRGIAISSAKLKLTMGEEGFKEWLSNHQITYNKTDGAIAPDLTEAR